MAAAERRIDALARRCYVGLDAASLRDETLRGLRAIVPIDAAFFAVVDPATMLFTAILAAEPLSEARQPRSPKKSGRAIDGLLIYRGHQLSRALLNLCR